MSYEDKLAQINVWERAGRLANAGVIKREFLYSPEPYPWLSIPSARMVKETQ